MHHWLASKFLPSGLYLKTKSLPKGSSLQDKTRSASWDQPRSTSASPAISRSAFSSSTQLSKVSTSTAGTGVSTEELDCFRSMRGTSINSTVSLNSAMSSDAQELADRLRSVQHAGERHKKVFDSGGQGYSILVTHEEVRVCHVDEKGEYHYQHLPLPAPRNPVSRRSRRTSNAADKPEDVSAASSTQASRAGSRAASAERKADKPKKKQSSRHQLVKDRDGRTLVDITPHSVTVFHDGGVWRCHRMLGKIWDSDYATHVTARMPRAWSRRPSADTKRSSVYSALDSDELRKANGWSDEAVQDDDENKQEAVELLLCSNTPGERGAAPRAFKSFYHDL